MNISSLKNYLLVTAASLACLQSSNAGLDQYSYTPETGIILKDTPAASKNFVVESSSDKETWSPIKTEGTIEFSKLSKEKTYRIRSEKGNIAIETIDYHGWKNALRLTNGIVEATIVPEIARVLQYRFIGEEGVLFEDENLHGGSMSPDAKPLKAFGGDRPIIAPQSEWKIFEYKWAFDRLPFTASFENGLIVLTSPVIPNYGVQCKRKIRLVPNESVMLITTMFKRVEKPTLPNPISIWTITQIRNPLGSYSPRSENTIFGETGVHVMSGKPTCKAVDGLITMNRLEKTFKVGLDGSSLLGVFDKHTLRVDSPRIINTTYPDGGSSEEVYIGTGKVTKHFVELENLSPLNDLPLGESMQTTNVYTIAHRKNPSDPETEARAIFAAKDSVYHQLIGKQ